MKTNFTATHFFKHILFISFLLVTTVTAGANSTITNLVTHFKVSIIGDDVMVKWTCHQDVRSFRVEVATEADKEGNLIFNEIEYVQPSKGSNYIYMDKTPGKDGLRYYRVVMIDLYGVEGTTDVMTANFMYRDHFTINVLPDDMLQTVTLQINSKCNSEAVVKVTSLKDNYLIEKSYKLTFGWNEFKIKMETDAENGPFLLTFTIDEHTQHVMFKKENNNSLMVSDDQ